MNKLLCGFIIIVGIVILSSCSSESNKPVRYYYSESGVDSHKQLSDTVLDLSRPIHIENFIRGKTFVSKGHLIVFDDSLKVTFYNNGKVGSIYQCEVAQYSIKGERLLLLNDSIHQKILKFTVASNGILTNMETYSLYKIRE